MSVSTVNPGFGANQSALNIALSQRANVQPAADARPGNGGTAVPPGLQESAAVSLDGPAGLPIPHPIRVGVAAYAAIMNPQASASMRAEA